MIKLFLCVQRVLTCTVIYLNKDSQNYKKPSEALLLGVLSHTHIMFDLSFLHQRYLEFCRGLNGKVLCLFSKGRRITAVLVTQKCSTPKFTYISTQPNFYISTGNSQPVWAPVWKSWSRVIVTAYAPILSTFPSTLGCDQVMNCGAGQFSLKSSPVCFAYQGYSKEERGLP